MKPLHPVAGVVAGGAIVAAAAYVQAHSGSPLNLPTPVWIAALIPTGVGLITGGYLKRIKTPLFDTEIESLPKVEQNPTHSPAMLPSGSSWTTERAAEYARVDGYMLAHLYRPSSVNGQTFDIFIFLVRHRKGSDGPPRRNFNEILSIEFFFGDAWGNEVFMVNNSGGVLGVHTSAWGSFLASARLIFKDPNRAPITLHRYIDFHMLQAVPVEAADH